MNKSNKYFKPMIKDVDDIHKKIEYYKIKGHKIVRYKLILIIAFFLITLFDVVLGLFYVYNNPILPHLCALIMVINFTVFPICFVKLDKQEKELIIQMKKYTRKIDEFYNIKKS